jgi:preprotein translocase subunit Sss1
MSQWLIFWRTAIRAGLVRTVAVFGIAEDSFGFAQPTFGPGKFGGQNGETRRDDEEGGPGKDHQSQAKEQNRAADHSDHDSSGLAIIEIGPHVLFIYFIFARHPTSRSGFTQKISARFEKFSPRKTQDFHFAERSCARAISRSEKPTWGEYSDVLRLVGMTGPRSRS